MNYNDFRAWAGKVKAKGGSAAGVQGVMSAENAWLSYALGQNTLLETVPTDGDLAVEAFEPTAKTGTFACVSAELLTYGGGGGLMTQYGFRGVSLCGLRKVSRDFAEGHYSVVISASMMDNGRCPRGRRVRLRRARERR